MFPAAVAMTISDLVLDDGSSDKTENKRKTKTKTQQFLSRLVLHENNFPFFNLFLKN